MSFDINELKSRMQGVIDNFKKELSGLRTGRASANLLEPVHVDAYGSKMPLSQCASISVPEPRMISVNVWDKGLVVSVEKAIREADLGMNPTVDGQVIRLLVPELNEERRKELVKIAHKYAEQTRVSVRHVRRDGLDILKKLEKDSEISEDDHRRKSDEIQKLVDEFIKTVDEILAKKETEIMQV